MKTHELINVLNHFPPHSEWNGGDVVQTQDGKQFSLDAGARAHRNGKPPKVEVEPKKEEQGENI